jgi:hypothetical protein
MRKKAMIRRPLPREQELSPDWRVAVNVLGAPGVKATDCDRRATPGTITAAAHALSLQCPRTGGEPVRIRHRFRPVVAALALNLILVSSEAARAQQIGAFAADGYAVNSWCNLPTGSGSFYIVYNGGPYANGDYKTVRFAVSLPSAPELFILGAWVMGPGDVPVSTLQAGVTVQLGSCRADAVTVARVDYFLPIHPAGCSLVKVVPDPSAPSGKIEFTRCDDELVYLNEGTIAGNIGSSSSCSAQPANPPSNPVPADGATIVNPDADLSALLHWPSIVLGCFQLYGDGVRVFFGTDPNPPLYKSEATFPGFPLDVGTLQPGTTYYWRVTYLNSLGPSGLSPTWRFTTAGPLATEPSTWGRVKALYRD